MRVWPKTRVTIVSAISALPPFGLGERVHVREAVLDQRPRGGLRHVASKAGVAAWSQAAQEVAVAVLIMRDADHGRLALLGESPRVAGQAFVGVEVERVALDGMRDQRRLVRIVSAP